MNVLETGYFYWALGLVILVPATIVLLNEGIDRARRTTNPYTDLLLMMRDILLPLLVTVILLRYVFTVNPQNLPTKFISTVFWGVLMIAVFRLTRKVIGNGSYSTEDWRNMVPHMFLRLPPYTIMGLIVFHVVQNLWSLPIREMATTLGIGSIVIAFALQDTLSNLVSGILLVANSPFKPGDWVHVGDVEGKITAVNWRYTNIETWTGDLVVIPNGAIAGESIENHNRPSRTTAITESFGLSYEHPPNTVKAMFDEVFSNTPGILKDPTPSVAVSKFTNSTTMEYTAEFWIGDYGDKSDIHAEFMSRVWYAIQRHRIKLPDTVYKMHTYSGQLLASSQQVAIQNSQRTRLDRVPHFSLLPQKTREHLATSAKVMHYAKDEIIINQHEVESGACVILSGVVSLSRFSEESTLIRLHTLHAGEFFGETGLFGKGISPVTAISEANSEILCIPYDEINDVINHNPVFANDINMIIEQRRTRAEHALNSARESNQQTTSQTNANAVEEL